MEKRAREADPEEAIKGAAASVVQVSQLLIAHFNAT
jgi:hypothetical protein